MGIPFSLTNNYESYFICVILVVSDSCIMQQ